MAHYTYSAHAKAALRKAITSHPQWPQYSQLTGLSSANLNIDAMEAIAGIFENPKIDLTQYGTTGRKRRSWGNNGQPVPKPISPDEVAILQAQLEAVAIHVKPYRLGFAQGVLDTIKGKQNGWASEAQAKALRDIVAEGQAAAHGTAVTAEPVYSSNPSISQIPEPQPIPQPHSTLPANDAALLAMLKQLLGAQQAQAAPLDETRIIDLIKQHAGQPATMRIDLGGAAQLPQLGEQLAHHKLPLLVSAIQAGVNVMLVGEAGSGKTKATEQAAQLLGREYAFSGAVDSPYKLTGFIDAQGRLSRTALREAVEHGWIFCMDEIDGCLPGAVLPLNALASNRMADFPDGIVKAHPDFALVACANTYGRGADRLYVGRNAQDAAVMDRWAVISWDIDPTVEAGMLGLPAPVNAPKPVQLAPITDARALEAIAVDWLNLVRKTRAAVQKHKLRHVVSPRASQMGVKLLAAGWPWDEVTESCLYKGLDADSRAKLI